MNSQSLMDAIGVILGAILWYGLVPYLRQHAKTTYVRFLEGIAERAVLATELMLSNETSRAKLLHALDVVAVEAKRFHINLTRDEWIVYINRAVKNLKDAGQEIKKGNDNGNLDVPRE